MDDKTRILLLKYIAVLGIAGSYFNLYVAYSIYKDLQKSEKRSRRRRDLLHDANEYIKAIVEVVEPTHMQLAEIHEKYDLGKWQDELINDETIDIDIA